MTPHARRNALAQLQECFAVSERRACRVIGVARSSVRYQPRPRLDQDLSQRLRTLAAERPRFGYRRLHALLRREGQLVNHKRVCRLYRAAELRVSQRRRKRLARTRVAPTGIGVFPNQRWSLDCMQDTRSSGRRLRTRSVLATCTREALALAVDTSLPSRAVTRVLDRIIGERQTPQSIVLDNGPELTSRWVDQWAAGRGIQLAFIEPGKPIQNAVMESFNGRFRDECLNQHWFTSLTDARQTIETWRIDDNRARPHSSLS